MKLMVLTLNVLVKGPLLLIALVYYLPYALVVSLKYEDENDELFATEADSGRPSGYKYTGFRYYKDKKAGSLVERAKLLKATKRWNSVGYIAVFDMVMNTSDNNLDTLLKMSLVTELSNHS